MRTLHPHDADYPARLHALKGRPHELTLSAPLEPAAPVVAIVGTRHPCSESDAFARALAASVVCAGGIVASGGAFGIDTAAHEGALDAGGRTWAVAPSGCDFDVPQGNTPLYARIRASAGSAIVWPFARGERGRYAPFLARNRVLAVLADALVVVQAGFKSGARNAAKWAREESRPVWVVVPAPWQRPAGAATDAPPPDFRGCALELGLGASLLADTAQLLDAVGLNREASAPLPSSTLARRPLEEPEVRVLKALSGTPRHADEVALCVGLDAPTVTTALLTLALENVVVEGPGGFFRRARGA